MFQPGRGLLTRIAARRSSDTAPIDEVDSIVAHLHDLLNTRQGEAATVTDFGVVDFADIVHQFPDAIATLQRVIRATVMRYEPRLKNIAVRHLRDDDNPLQLKFEITAQLARPNVRRALRFQTQVSAGGKFDVR